MNRKKAFFLDLLEDYFNVYLPMAKGLSAATITSYKTTFRLLAEYMYKVKTVPLNKVTFETLNSQTILEFLDWLESERKCSIATRNQRLSALAAFSMYAQNRDFGSAAIFRNSILKVPKKKIPRKGRSFFTREEVKVLLEIPDTTSEIGLRDQALLCFMYASGMRAQEVCDLTVGDIQFYPDRAGINVHGKGQKIRRIGIPYGAAKIMKTYIEHRHLSRSYKSHVFSSQTHEKMSVSCIEEIFTKYVALAQQRHPEQFRGNYTPHSMRHTTATHMLEAGVPLVVVKNFLGHVSMQTTQIYIEITQDTMNQQLEAWNNKWFLKENLDKDHTQNDIPDFLR